MANPSVMINNCVQASAGDLLPQCQESSMLTSASFFALATQASASEHISCAICR